MGTTTSRIDEMEQQIQAMQKEINELKGHRNFLEQEYSTLKEGLNSFCDHAEEQLGIKRSTQTPEAHISTEAIDHIVDELIADPDLKMEFVPDSIERKMYTNMLKVLLGVIQKTLDNASMEIIGHEFKIQMVEPQK